MSNKLPIYGFRVLIWKSGVTYGKILAKIINGVIRFMPIPAFRPDGYLPEGLHLETLEEIALCFGTSTPRRQSLLGRLERWVEFARAIGLLRFFVDGSFVTQKPTPGDVDAVVWLPPDFEGQVDAGSPVAVALAEMIETRQPEELFAAANALEWQDWVEFFSQTRELDGRRKGIVEVQL